MCGFSEITQRHSNSLWDNPLLHLTSLLEEDSGMAWHFFLPIKILDSWERACMYVIQNWCWDLLQAIQGFKFYPGSEHESEVFQSCPTLRPHGLLFSWLSHVWLFATPWTAARQSSLSITNYQSLLKLMSIESVMPSNHLILCCPLLLPPSIFPRIRVFSFIFKCIDLFILYLF